MTHTYCLHVWKNSFVLKFFGHFNIYLGLTGQGTKVANKKNKFKLQSLLIDCIDTFDLVILWRQLYQGF